MTRPDNPGPPHDVMRESWSVKAGRLAAERPLPWVIAGLVFLANALLSATRGDWWLAALETGTGVLAGISALSLTSRRDAAAPNLEARGDPPLRNARTKGDRH